MCYLYLKYFYDIYRLINKIGEIIRLLFRSSLQLLYASLIFYTVLVKLSTGVICYFAIGFIYCQLRAGYCMFSHVILAMF